MATYHVQAACWARKSSRSRCCSCSTSSSWQSRQLPRQRLSRRKNKRRLSQRQRKRQRQWLPQRSIIKAIITVGAISRATSLSSKLRCHWICPTTATRSSRDKAARRQSAHRKPPSHRQLHRQQQRRRTRAAATFHRSPSKCSRTRIVPCPTTSSTITSRWAW